MRLYTLQGSGYKEEEIDETDIEDLFIESLLNECIESSFWFPLLIYWITFEYGKFN